MSKQYSVPYNINTLFEQVSVAIVILRGPTFAVETINGTALQLIGKTQQEAVGQSIIELMPFLVNQGFEKILKEVYNTGTGFSAEELPVYLADLDTTIYVNISYQALRNDKGEVDGIINLVNNVTEQVLAKQAAKQNEIRLSEVVKQAPVGITILTGTTFLVESANELYLQLVDRSDRDFVGRPLFESLPEVESAVRPLLVKVWNTGEPFYGYEFEAPLRRHGKIEKAYFNFVYQPLKNATGETTGIIVVANEVSEQVRAKLSVAEQQKEFKNMVMRSPIAMTVFRGRDFVIEMANETLLKNIWRRKFEDVKDKKLFDLFPELKDQKYERLLNQVMDTGVPHRENESMAYVNAPDGSMNKYYLDFEYAPLHNAEGAIDGLMITVNDVTEKVLARQRIEESESYFRSMTDSVPVMIFVTAADGGFFFKNKQWYAYTGQTPEEMEGRGWLNAVHPQDKDAVGKAYQEALNKQEPFNIEMRLKGRDGSYQWFEKIGTPRFDGDGNFAGYVGSTVNTNIRKQSTDKLSEAEERLRMAAEAAELGSWDIDLQTGDFVYSDKLLEMFGLPKGKKYLREDFWALIHPEDVKNVVQPANVTAIEKGVYKYEARILFPDGKINWIKPQGKVYYDKEGKPARMIGTIMDITAEKNAAQVLEESRLLFKTITEASPVGLWLSDETNKSVFINDTWVKWSGMRAEENLSHGWLAPVIEEDRDKTIQAFFAAVPEQKYFVSEFRLKRADGEYRWCITEGFPFYDKDGNFKGYAGSVTDITETKMAQEVLENKVQERTAELNAKNVELERSNNELEQFAYIASHDLQEPLRKIQTFTELIQMNRDNPERANEYYEKITAAAKRMSNLIREVLNFSRLSKTEKDEFTAVDLNTLLDDIAVDFELQLKEKNARLNVGKLPVIKGTSLQLTQLFSNLIGNALKFSKDMPEVKIIARSVTAEEVKAIPHLDKTKQYTMISVSDNGIGFDQKHADQIFTIFQRLNSDVTYKGTGIGLAICKKVVQNHHGHISAMGQPGEGATFNVYLPLD